MEQLRSTSSAAISSASHRQERADLAAAFRWAARLTFHEGVANHFSVTVNEDGTQFLMNPNLVHFRLIKASDLILIDANDPETLNRPDAPDRAAWGLHGAIHRRCPHHRCLMHVHSIYATALACLEDSSLPPLDQNAAMFFNRTVIDENYGGLAFDDEAERCAAAMGDPTKKVMIMGNHGVMPTCSVKVFRYQLVASAILLQLRKIRYPHRVVVLKYDGRPVAEDVLHSVMTFFVVFFLSLGVLAILLSLTGLDLVTSVSGAVAALGNIGPGLGDRIGPSSNFMGLNDAAKWLLIIGMLVGRLELMAVYILFTSKFWRN